VGIKRCETSVQDKGEKSKENKGLSGNTDKQKREDGK